MKLRTKAVFYDRLHEKYRAVGEEFTATPERAEVLKKYTEPAEGGECSKKPERITQKKE